MTSLYVQFGVRRRPPLDVLELMREMALYCDAHREKFGLPAEEELFDDYVTKIVRT